MTPLETWCLIGFLASAAVLAALAVERWLDRADLRADQRSVTQWQRMCDELDLYDWSERDDV